MPLYNSLLPIFVLNLYGITSKHLYKKKTLTDHNTQHHHTMQKTVMFTRCL